MPAELDRSRAADPLAGTGYRSLRTIAAGGMGIVVEVEHLELGKVFIAKILANHLASDASIVDRMRLEAQALGKLRHDNVVAVSDFTTTTDGRPVIVMERLVGRTLGAEVRARGALPALEAIEIVAAALDGLEQAHRIGVVHRDFKLENVFLHEEAGSGRRIVKVLDFGLAKVIHNVPDRSPQPLALPTGEGVMIGTPRFLSPEQAQGRPVDARSDVYAAGLVLHALLTGKPPWHGIDDPELLVAAQAGEEPPPPSTITDAPIPAELERAVLQALSKDPRARFSTAAAFTAQLRSIAELMRTPGVGWLETVHLGAFMESPEPDRNSSASPRPAAGVIPRQSDGAGTDAVAKDIATPTKHSIQDSPRERRDLDRAPALQQRAEEGGSPSAGKAPNQWVFALIVLLAVGAIVGLFWLVGRFFSN